MEVKPPNSDRQFYLGLLIILIAALITRLLILDEFIKDNPFSEAFFSDDWVYWVMAGAKAAGQWLEQTPFLSAPLFPYLLGLLRSLGGDLYSVYISQLILGLGSILLIAFGTKRRFGNHAALIASAIFAFCEEPTISFTRVMADSLQIFLVSLVWFFWCRLRLTDKPSLINITVTGLLIGLLSLAWPPAQLLLLIYAVDLFFSPNPLLRRFAVSSLGAISGLLIIGMATLHNYAADGQFVLISANSGINLLQGNNKNAQGIITPLEGIRTDRQHMYDDMALVYQQAKGQQDDWKLIDDYFKQQAWNFILTDTDKSLPLFAKKFYWFISSTEYDNISVLSLEQEYGLFQRAKLSPIELPWLMGLALLGILILIRKPQTYLPELSILGVTIISCVLFHYSARYRLPAAPILAILSGVAISHWRCIPLPVAGRYLICLLPLLLIGVNHKSGFAKVDFMRADTGTKIAHAYVEVGDRRVRNAQLDQARAYYQQAIQADPNYPTPYFRLVHLSAINKESNINIEGSLDPAVANEIRLLQQRLAFNQHLNKADYQAANEQLEKMLQADPSNRQLQERQILLLLSKPDQNDHIDKAVKLAKKLLVNSPGQLRIDGLKMLALSQYLAGQKSNAEITINKAIKMAERSQVLDHIEALEKLRQEIHENADLDWQVGAFPIDDPWDPTKAHPMDLIAF